MDLLINEESIVCGVKNSSLESIKTRTDVDHLSVLVVTCYPRKIVYF